MSSNQIIQLNQNVVQVGLGTLTCTLPAALLNGPSSYSNAVFNVQAQIQVPSAIASGNGAGEGYGTAPGGSGGSNPSNLIQQGPAFSGDQGLGASGGSQGIGQGSNLSLGNGGKGLGFGGSANDNAASNINYPAVSSGLSVVVNKNGSPIYTAPALTPTQSSLQFKFDFLASANDVITIVLSSSTSSDEQLQGVSANISVNQGM